MSKSEGHFGTETSINTTLHSLSLPDSYQPRFRCLSQSDEIQNTIFNFQFSSKALHRKQWRSPESENAARSAT
ncbi:hypothetical protein Sjap_010050 [Stephania japonica]|uniref:Uncharacterized protein n=1 Tax=Stephania japonica TaxID=461633 RepID=A0AAP0P3W3_9MAGN